MAEDAVVTGAAGYAAVEWANFATNRANVAGTAAAKHYRDWGESQLSASASTQRVRAASRCRQRSLQPRPRLSRNVVSWELTR